MQGKYQEAAGAYARAGSVHRAMDMFSDLRQFAEAKAWAQEWERTKAPEQAPLRPGLVLPDQSGTGPLAQALVQKQAEWSEEMKDFQAAANMYLQVSQLRFTLTVTVGTFGLAEAKDQEHAEGRFARPRPLKLLIQHAVQ